MLKFFLLFIVLSGQALAGNGSHGGVSIVCRDQAGVIKSAELVDIYEGQNLYHLEYASSPLSVEELISASKKSLATHPEYLEDLNENLAQTQAHIIFVPEDHVLESTNDAFPVMRRKGCEFEQLANYMEDGTLLISKEIYDRLDNMNKAALYLHEGVYAMRRLRGDKDSKLSRELVAHLFSRLVDQAAVDFIVSFSHPRKPGPVRPQGTAYTRPNEPLRKIYVYKQEEMVTVTDFNVLENEIGFSFTFKLLDAVKKIYVSAGHRWQSTLYLRYLDDQTIIYAFELYEAEEASARRIWKKD